ncbi:MAG: hypothetical protein M3N47_03640 [Chloroflexota bacterium]|nr:hypothetical protein [Chloroflexota bacterium]
MPPPARDVAAAYGAPLLRHTRYPAADPPTARRGSSIPPSDRSPARKRGEARVCGY